MSDLPLSDPTMPVAVEDVVRLPGSRKLLEQALSSPILEGDFVSTLLEEIGNRAADVVEELADNVYIARSGHPDQLQKRYSKPSSWQPESKFDIAGGKMLPQDAPAWTCLLYTPSPPCP